MNTIIKYGFILGLICFLASSVLGIVNAITEPKIKLQKLEEENLGLREVIPEAALFRPKIQDGKTIYYTAYNPLNKLDGFVIKSESKGYSSNIEVLVGLNPKLEITNIKILSQNETPGLGNKIIEPFFKERFKGKNPDDQIQAITGATISSNAVIKGIKNKISELKEQLLQEVQFADADRQVK